MRCACARVVVLGLGAVCLGLVGEVLLVRRGPWVTVIAEEMWGRSVAARSLS